VKKNLMSIAGFTKDGGYNSRIEVNYLQFTDNSDEEQAMKHFCNDIGVTFLARPAHYAKGVDHVEIVDRLLVKPSNIETSLDLDNLDPSIIPYTSACWQVFDCISLDYKGDVYLCCCRYYFDEYKIGNFLELSPEELLYYKVTHPDCSVCTAQLRRKATDEDFVRLQRALYIAGSKDSKRVERLTYIPIIGIL
jgi:hypothetical protein